MVYGLPAPALAAMIHVAAGTPASVRALYGRRGHFGRSTAQKRSPLACGETSRTPDQPSYPGAKRIPSVSTEGVAIVTEQDSDHVTLARSCDERVMNPECQQPASDLRVSGVEPRREAFPKAQIEETAQRHQLARGGHDADDLVAEEDRSAFEAIANQIQSQVTATVRQDCVFAVDAFDDRQPSVEPIGIECIGVVTGNARRDDPERSRIKFRMPDDAGMRRGECRVLGESVAPRRGRLLHPDNRASRYSPACTKQRSRDLDEAIPT